MKKIKLVNDTVSKKDIDYLIKWLKTYPRLTKGPITSELEQKFANNLNWIKERIRFVWSLSSAG